MVVTTDSRADPRMKGEAGAWQLEILF